MLTVCTFQGSAAVSSLVTTEVVTMVPNKDVNRGHGFAICGASGMLMSLGDQ